MLVVFRRRCHHALLWLPSFGKGESFCNHPFLTQCLQKSNLPKNPQTFFHSFPLLLFIILKVHYSPYTERRYSCASVPRNASSSSSCFPFRAFAGLRRSRHPCPAMHSRPAVQNDAVQLVCAYCARLSLYWQHISTVNYIPTIFQPNFSPAPPFIPSLVPSHILWCAWFSQASKQTESASWGETIHVLVHWLFRTDCVSTPLPLPRHWYSFILNTCPRYPT